MLIGEIKKRNLLIFPKYSLQIEGKISNKLPLENRAFPQNHTSKSVFAAAVIYRSYFAKQDPMIYMKNHLAVHQWRNIIKSTKNI